MASKLTNEEIARQFQLPERKSKLKSLLKQEREEYCLCRSSDTTRFMIGCDACEDWFHGDCIGISEKESKMIKLYYCQACRVEDPSLKILYRPGRKLEQRSYEDDDEEVSFNVRRKSPEAMKRKGDDVPGYGKRPKSSKTATKLLGKPPEKKSTWKRTKGFSYRGRRSGQATRSDSDSDYGDEHIDREPPDHVVHVSNVGSAYKDNMQCYGPGCVNVARKDSKYCSDVCGLKLATNRLLHILPHRVHDWTQTESVAEKFAFELLNEYRQSDAKAKEELKNLDAKNEKLNEAIKRAKEFTVDPNYTKSASEEADTTLYCITCGHEIHVRTALKHMDKCYNKYEGQSTFGSLYKTKIEGSNMFCDFFNPSNRTYCKRLRVLCPEHYKEPKVGKDEICGCPLVVEVFTETGEICKNPKKDCSRHFGWEKMRQAEIDMERVRQWLTIDELSEKIRHLMQRVSGKVGTLPLLLHSTYDHDLKEKMSPEEDQKLLKSLEESLVSRYGRKDRLSKLQ